MDRRYQEILKFLTVGETPLRYNKGEKCNFKRFCTKFTLKDGEIFVGKRQLVRSKEEAWTLFREIHILPVGGHTGINKTSSILSKKWYWQGMNVDIRKWIQECEECQKAEKPLPAPKPLKCIKVTAVWEFVGIDLVGPYPTTRDGYQYIFTAVDYFSKWVEAFPMKSKSAVEVSEQICNLIYQHGCPKRILSDQETEFINQLNEQVCNILGRERTVIVAYHPQTNIFDEETNQNIKRALTNLVNDQQENWDIYLKQTLFSLRSKVHKTTNFSPFLLMHGREAVFPSEVVVQLPLLIVLPEKETYESLLEKKKASAKLTHTEKEESIKKAPKRPKKQNNDNAKTESKEVLASVTALEIESVK